jgi:hypothetical protein
MEASDSSEALEITYQPTLCDYTEDHNQTSTAMYIKYAAHNVLHPVHCNCQQPSENK